MATKSKKISHFIECGKLWTNEDGTISGVISLGPLGEIPFIARKSQFGDEKQMNMIVAANKTPIGMLKTMLTMVEASTDDGEVR